MGSGIEEYFSNLSVLLNETDDEYLSEISDTPDINYTVNKPNENIKFNIQNVNQEINEYLLIVYNMQGQVVSKTNFSGNSHSIQMNNQPPDIYVYQLKYGNTVKKGKIFYQ